MTEHERKVLFLKRKDNPCNERKITKRPVMLVDVRGTYAINASQVLS